MKAIAIGVFCILVVIAHARNKEKIANQVPKTAEEQLSEDKIDQAWAFCLDHIKKNPMGDGSMDRIRLEGCIRAKLSVYDTEPN